MKFLFWYICILFLPIFLTAQKNDSDFLTSIFKTNNNTLFQEVIQHPKKYRLQIIYTKIDRDKKNQPHFTTYNYEVDSNFYFYPASTVKLPIAVLSLEKLNNLNIKGVNKFTPIAFDSTYSREVNFSKDTSSPKGKPNIAHFIKQVLLISENDACNRMYEFLTPHHINNRLHNMGYTNTRLIHRLAYPLTIDENRHTNRVKFFDNNNKVIYVQEPSYNNDSINFNTNEFVGNAHYSNGKLLNAPFNFSVKNRISLNALTNILKAVMFPASLPKKQQFNLKKDDYLFLRQYLSQYPSETNFPKYNTTEFYDSYVKFYFNDSLHHTMPKNVRVFNKVGWAFGFITDISYVVDFKNKIEFMLSATIYANSDEVINDDKYDEETVAHPFLYQLGQTIYEYELKRKRNFSPNLNAFKINYEKRKIE